VTPSASDGSSALSSSGFDVAIVSGTRLGNVDGQLAARPTGPEVFAVGPDGPSLMYRRTATAGEDEALTTAARLAVSRLKKHKLRATIVGDRLNRRKIDLLPGPAWADPRKAEIRQLLAAVEERLHASGFAELAEVAELARAAAREAGLTDPRVTSDVKHIEIGLTDKSDSARWVLAELGRRGIGAHSVLIGGDEFGSIGGLAGSDSLMLISDAAASTKVSVGVEPNGVPAGVIALGGGSDAFVAVLEDQLRRRELGELPLVESDPQWTLSIEGFDPTLERAHEALLTLADGCIGTSDSPLLGQAATSPRVLAGGVYDEEGAESHLVHGPGWTRVVRGLDPAGRLRRVLDLRNGTLLDEVSLPDGQSLRMVRFSSASRPGTVVLRAEGPEAHFARGHALSPPGGEKRCRRGTHGGREWMQVRASHGGVTASAADMLRGDRDSCRVDRLGGYVVGADEVPDPARAVAKLLAAEEAGFERLLHEQRECWGERWDCADVMIEGDPELQQAVRLALFHLMASVAEQGETALGARGLTGPGYRGHVFWDTDVFVLPYLAATRPRAARTLLEYRIRRLPAARREARTLGRAGARFPWESARSGRDVTPSYAHLRSGEVIPIRTGELEEHVVADVAWAASSYLDWTGDEAFRDGPGLTLLVETARYWASRIRLDGDGHGHIEGVIGPDEYHEAVDDNAYTNVMARWNLRRAAAAVTAGDGSVPESERACWLALAEALVDGYDPATRIYEQFAGFSELEPLVIDEIAPRRPVAAELLLGQERLRSAQVVKQADVLLLHHLVPDEVAPGSLRPNLLFYEPRTAHGSSLSPGIHASLLARAGMLTEALEALQLTSRIDLDDLTQTTAGGLHLAAMGSLWQALAFGFAGLRPTDDCLRVDPHLPADWRVLELRVRFRGSRVVVRAEPDVLTLVADPAVRFCIGDTSVLGPPSGLRLVRRGHSWKEVNL
jgi:trehalose/maltose hydrolase-like predicted phosphorylase